VSQLLSKITVASYSFYIKMFNVSALLLDDALLKCVVTEVVLFSIVALKVARFEKLIVCLTTCGNVAKFSVSKK